MTEEVQEPEVETQEINPIEDLVNHITAGELNKAEGSFQSIIQDKMADALDAQRIAVAQNIFNTPEGLDDEEIVDETIEDEDDEDLELATDDVEGDVGVEDEDESDSTDEEDDFEISDEEIEAAIETVFDEDEEILAQLDDDED